MRNANPISKIAFFNMAGFLLVILSQSLMGHIITIRVEDIVHNYHHGTLIRIAQSHIDTEKKRIQDLLNSYALWSTMYKKIRERDVKWIESVMRDLSDTEFSGYGIYLSTGKALITKGVSLGNKVNEILNRLTVRYPLGVKIDHFMMFANYIGNKPYIIGVSPIGDDAGKVLSHDFMYIALPATKIADELSHIFQLSGVSVLKTNTFKMFCVPLKGIDGSTVACIYIPTPKYMLSSVQKLKFTVLAFTLGLAVAMVMLLIVLERYYTGLEEDFRKISGLIKSIGSLSPDMAKNAGNNVEASGEMGELFKAAADAASSVVKGVYQDPLTSAYNRRYFFIKLKEELERVKRYNRPMSLAVLDIDDFKKINDTYGHPVGDVVLVELAKTIKRNIRSTDVFARVGGEEFAIIFTETDVKGAAKKCEMLRSEIEKLTIRTYGRVINLTISIGVTQAKPTDTVDTLYKRADKALYRAKQTGKNRVVTVV